MTDVDASKVDDGVEIEVLELLGKLTGLQSPWQMKEQLLSRLNIMLQQHGQETEEAILCARPASVIDSIMAFMVSGRIQPSSKLLAADVLSTICSNTKAYLLLCPSSVVERLMRCAYKGDADVKAAAARALWQLSCHDDFSPEVVSHAGNAFKVVELLAQDIQGGSSTCMCALRATQNLLHTYAASTAGDAGDRIGGRMVEPLCNLLDPGHLEAASAAAELLALLAQSAPNRARILAAGGIPRLVALMRQGAAASSSAANSSTVGSSGLDHRLCESLYGEVKAAAQPSAGQLAGGGLAGAGYRQQQLQGEGCPASNLQEAAAQAALHALAQLTRSDAQLCLELLGAHIMPALLQLLRNKGCCGGALSLIGDLASLPEGRRAVQYADGFAALSEVAQDCPEYQLCRLLSKATKGTTATSHDLAGLLSSSELLAVLVRCCSPADRKTRKRAMQVLVRLLEHCKAAGSVQQLQQQLLKLGLLQQILVVLTLPPQQRAASAAGGGSVASAGLSRDSAASNVGTAGSSSSSSQGTVLEVQLAVTLLHDVAACPEILYSCSTAATGGAGGGGNRSSSSSNTAVVTAQGTANAQEPSSARQQQQQQQLEFQQPNKLLYQPCSAPTTLLVDRPGRNAAVANAILATPSFVWKHPAAAAAAFGDMTRLVPDIQSGVQCASSNVSTNSSSVVDVASQQHAVQAVQQQQAVQPLQAVQAVQPQHAVQAVQPLNPVLPHILWQLQQLLLSPVHQLPSLQQQVLQVMAAIAAHRHTDLLAELVRQGWVQVLWSFLPGGRQLLAVTLTQLIQQQQQQQGKLKGSQQQQLPSAGTQQQQQQQQAGAASLMAAAVAGGSGKGSRSSSLQPHLLQLLDESLPSLEQTMYALQALACLCSCPAAVAIAVQLQSTYQAASASGMLTVRSTAYLGAPASAPASTATTPTAAAAGGLAAMLFGSSSAAVGTISVTGTKAAPGLTPLPQSPRTVMGTSPLGFASSSSSSSSAHSTVGSFVAVRNPVSSSFTASSSIVDVDSSNSSNMRRSSSTGLLSRLGISRQRSTASSAAAAAADAGAAAAGVSSSTSKATGSNSSSSTTGQAAAAAPYDPSAPVEDPGSPIQMLVTLLGEQWAATAAAELLAQLAAAGSAVCIPAMLDQGVTVTLAECMREIQPNSAGAVAALSTLLLVQQLGKHCPEQLHACRIVAIVLQMLQFECKDNAAAAASVRAAALQVLAVLCGGHGGHADRQLCATVAQVALRPLLQSLCGSTGAAAAAASTAAAVLDSLLESGAVDAAAIAAVKSSEERTELLKLCLRCLIKDGPQQQQQQSVQPPQQQQQLQLTAVRLLRAFVELDGKLVEAFLAAEGLQKLIAMLSAAVAAANSSSNEQLGSPAAAAAAAQHRHLMMQYEIMAILDSLSLCHRRVLVLAAIIPIIVGILRQQQHGQQQQGQQQTVRAGSSSSSGVPRTLSRRLSSKTPGAVAGIFAAEMTSDELLLRCKVIACNLITVLAINNDVKRQLFNSDAVGPLMQLADTVSEGSTAQEAIRAALAQLGLVYLLPATTAPPDSM